jgi:hypothetical protein
MLQNISRSKIQTTKEEEEASEVEDEEKNGRTKRSK